MRIPLRRLKNHPSEVLRQVEAGESLTVTVSGRPVAQLVPLPGGEPWVSVERGRAALAGLGADPGLAREAEAAFADTTADL